jgi:hypothetical protein
MIPKQSVIMDSFNKCVENLITEIRIITKENSHDEEMMANKTRKAIMAWFRNGGKIRK